MFYHSNYNYFPHTVAHIKVLKLMQLTKHTWLKKNGHEIKVCNHCCLNYGPFRNTPARAQAGVFFG